MGLRLRLLLAAVRACSPFLCAKGDVPRAREALDECEPHRARVHPRPGPVQRRAAAGERRFRRVRAAAWRVSAAPWPVRGGCWPVPAAPWRVRVHPCPVSIAPWACVSRGLGACEMTLGACKSSLGVCHLMFIHNHLRTQKPDGLPIPLSASRSASSLPVEFTSRTSDGSVLNSPSGCCESVTTKTNVAGCLLCPA